MGHHHPLRLKLAQVGQQRTKVQMKPDALLKKIGLCDQEVGSFACWNKGLRPLSIARIRDNFSCTRNAQGQCWIAAGMLYTVRSHSGFSECMRSLELELLHVQGKCSRCLSGARKEDLHCFRQSFLRAGWSHNH